MPRYVRNSRYNKIFLLIFLGAALFISFQLLSLKVLSKSASQQSRILEESSQDEKLIDSIKEADSDAHEPARKSDVAVPPKYDFRGVSPEDGDLYVPDEDNMFTCLQSKKKVPFSTINDEYCDCDDYTDEPGTSACDFKFYCKQQFPNQPLIVLPSNRVNDGICDCCDGSDEWKNLGPPDGVVPENRDALIVKYAPCKNHCDKLIQETKEDARIQSMGKRLKQTYIIAAKHIRDKENYGPSGVFYKLSQACFTHKAKPYEYKVCPFKSIIQENFPQQTFNLGKVSEWVHKKNGRYILKMYGGDSYLCPDLGRRSMITFLCGLHDRVISLQEDEKCSYAIRFSTPAAC